MAGCLGERLIRVGWLFTCADGAKSSPCMSSAVAALRPGAAICQFRWDVRTWATTMDRQSRNALRAVKATERTGFVAADAPRRAPSLSPEGEHL